MENPSKPLQAGTEMRIIEQAELLDAIVSTMAQGLLVVDADGLIVMTNERVRTMHNLPEELCAPGTHFLELARYAAARGYYGPGDPEVLAQARWRAASAGNDRYRELSIGPNDLQYEVTGRSMPGGGFVNTYTDVTERKHTEQLLRAALERLEQTANTDALTGLANRRQFDEFMQCEWRRCLRRKLPLSVLIIDADNFKLFNDHYGHLAGDECLRAIASQIAAVARRPGDLAARYGGEEFVLLMPETGESGALHVANRLRILVQELEVIHEGNPPTGMVTVSIGLATCLPNAPGSIRSSPADLLSAADRSLYQAKRDGRNRVGLEESTPA